MARKQDAVPQPANHPAVVRWAHWGMAVAVVIMILSGWRIYDAAPIFKGFYFPERLTLGGWLAGALLWHFAAMWLLAGCTAVYVGYNTVTGRFYRKFWPLSVGGALREAGQAFTLRLGHADLNVYNMLQRFFYLGAVVLIAGLVGSGLVMWKPVQFPVLRALLGDYDTAREVHFVLMALLAGYVLVHVAMVVLVPRALVGMLGFGRRNDFV